MRKTKASLSSTTSPLVKESISISRSTSAPRRRINRKKRSSRRLVTSSSLVFLAASSSSQHAGSASAFLMDSGVRHYAMTRSVDSGSSHFMPRLRTSCHVSTSASSSWSRSRLAHARSSMDPLSYRNGDESEEAPAIIADVVVTNPSVVTKKEQKQRQFRWHQSILGLDESSSSSSTPGRMSNEQMLLDQYLESIDRRYHRLHDDEKVGSINWTWDWLMRGDSQNSNISKSQGSGSPSHRSCNEGEDALCVLGLADLASDRLLKQHRLPRHSSTVTVTNRDIEEEPSIKKHPLFRLVRAIRRKRAKCAAMMALHSRKNHKRVFTAISSRAPSLVVMASKVLLSITGTKKTLNTCQALSSFLTQAVLPKSPSLNFDSTTTMSASFIEAAPIIRTSTSMRL